MRKKLLKELKEKLEKEKASLEEELGKIAKKDPDLKDDWDSKFPRFDGEFGGAALEIGADEVEEYDARLPVEYSLETRLRDVNLALRKIKSGKYGKCENCKKNINEKRLGAYPAARLCMKCEKNKAR